MESERLLLIFERSPEESALHGVEEAIRALRQNQIDVQAPAQTPGDDGLFAKALRFWFPYLSRAGVVGVTPGADLESAANASTFVVTRPPQLGPAFGAVLGAWLHQRPGRMVRAKFDDVEIEARTPEQAASLMSRRPSA